MKRRILVALAVVVVLGAAWLGYSRFWAPRGTGNGALVLYGDVDVRQVDLSFKVAGRIAALQVDEGDHVTAGQALATLDKRYFDDALKIAQARRAMQEAALAKLEHGSRPEEIAEAQANVDLDKATVALNRVTLGRQRTLLKASVASQQTYDAALAAEQQAEAQLAYAENALRLAVLGPRQEDIDGARAQLALEQANETVAGRDLGDATLVAPSPGIITTRVREAGAIVNAGETVFTLTLDRPLWVRAYVSEPDLGRVHPGESATVTTDTPGGKTYHGTVGFISPVAEFTPKAVETAELRTALVYRLRVIVADPDDGLRQGMPVTVRFAAPAGTRP
jgi:HlyD family secretion protein